MHANRLLTVTQHKQVWRYHSGLLMRESALQHFVQEQFNPITHGELTVLNAPNQTYTREYAHG